MYLIGEDNSGILIFRFLPENTYSERYDFVAKKWVDDPRMEKCFTGEIPARYSSEDEVNSLILAS